jgi:hypothetical protein
MARLTVRRGSSESSDPHAALSELRAAVDQPGVKVVVLFCSPTYDLAALGSAIGETFPCPVVACTSAGQIGPRGYQRGGLTAASLASPELDVHAHLVAPLSACRQRAVEVAALVQARLDRLPPSRRAFGLLLADGLSLAEEGLVAALYQSLGDVPIVGGSAGDDLKFERTWVYWDGRFISDAAVFAVFDTSLPFSTFKLQHFRPTDRKLVITAADPPRRLVREINGLPAAEAYAEVLGLSADQLDAGVFSRHPVMLRIGADHYVRSIQRANADGSLAFYCAIEEGLVLSVGEGVDPLATLEQGFAEASRALERPGVVIGCDCILRRLELEQRELAASVGEFFARHQVVGFSTYGEQFNAVHVNQTFTAIALGG